MKTVEVKVDGKTSKLTVGDNSNVSVSKDGKILIDGISIGECPWWKDESLRFELGKAVGEQFNRAENWFGRVKLEVYNDYPNEGNNTTRYLQIHVADDFAKDEFEKLQDILAGFDFRLLDSTWTPHCGSYMAERVDADSSL